MLYDIGETVAYTSDCDADDMGSPLVASLSVWSESTTQLNARRLHALAVPMDRSWDSGEKLTAVLFCFQVWFIVPQ